MKILRRLFPRPNPLPVFEVPRAPEHPLFVIGDIHGRADLLECLLARLSNAFPPDGVLICVGDYVDRGDHCAAVLRRLQALTASDTPFTTICLMGNHERMMLDFLENPARHGPRWIRYGGLQTMASFGLGYIAESAAPEAWEKQRDVLRAAMGPGLEDWMANLELSWTSGNVSVVHAGADPALPIALQSSRTLLWGHEAFATTPRTDGQWVVHGHTIVDVPYEKSGRIAVDTGAYATGRLTAAALLPDGTLNFIQV